MISFKKDFNPKKTRFGRPLKPLVGFSLIEACVCIAILAIVGGILTPVLVQGIDAWIFVREQKRVTTELATGIELIGRRLREIRRFTMTIWGVRLDYRREASGLGVGNIYFSWMDSATELCLVETGGGGPFILAEGITNKTGKYTSVFTYFDQNDNMLDPTLLGGAVPYSQVAYIGIRLVADIKPGKPGGDTVFYTQVAVRGHER